LVYVPIGPGVINYLTGCYSVNIFLDVDTYEVMRVSRIGRSVRYNDVEPKKFVNASTIVSGWLTVRSCAPP
jgi:hypothetical protein